METKSDFMKICEPVMNETWSKFCTGCEKLNLKLESAHEILDGDMKSAYEKNCGKLLKKSKNIEICTGKVENCYEKVIDDLPELKNFENHLHSELKHLKRKKSYESDLELFGRTFKDQNEIITERLMMLETEKSLMEKIRKHLIKELESYQNQIDPEIEANVLQHLVETRKRNIQGVESQVNKEVSRIQKAFYDKWMKLWKVKQKFQIDDWKMRTELMPKIYNLHQKLFEKQEKLVKVQAEVEKLSVELEEKALADEKLDEEIEELQNQFEEFSEKIKNDSSETKNIQRKIKKIGLKSRNIEEEKEICLKNTKEDFAIFKKIKELQKENLESKLDQICKESKSKIQAKDCMIDSIKNSICQAKQEIRLAKIEISEIQAGIDNLMSKGETEIIGRDYLGSNFVEFVRFESD